LNNERKKAIEVLKTAKGQIEGIAKMIEEERDCIDTSNQIIEAQLLLKKANILILEHHLNNCVKDALINANGENKVDETI